MLQYAITDRRFFRGDERQRIASLLVLAKALSRSGVEYLQIREKDLPPHDLLALTLALRRILPVGSIPRLLVNGPAELALQAGADGLHLPGGWAATNLSAARTLFRAANRPGPLLSVTTHSLPEVYAARAAGADLILFGPVFEKRVRGELLRPGVGLAALAEAAAAATPTPLLALGGLSPANLAACLAAGASGVAAIRLFLPANSAPENDAATPGAPLSG